MRSSFCGTLCFAKRVLGICFFELTKRFSNTAKEPKEPQDDNLKQMEDLIYRLMGTLEMFTDVLDALADYKMKERN